jgi:hypothetical protein
MRSIGIRATATLLAVLLSAPSALWAQSDEIRIEIIAGDGAINNIDTRVVVDPIVEVQDASGKPIPKAVVTFKSPATGPSVTFFGAAHSSTVTTDDSGRAQASGIVPNTEQGVFYIDVAATHGDADATARITQTNAFDLGSPKEEKKKSGWKIWTLVGVAVAGGVAAALVGGDDGGTAATTVGVGGVTVGAPR